jgi:hypothetical protein
MRCGEGDATKSRQIHSSYQKRLKDPQSQAMHSIHSIHIINISIITTHVKEIPKR